MTSALFKQNFKTIVMKYKKNDRVLEAKYAGYKIYKTVERVRSLFKFTTFATLLKICIMIYVCMQLLLRIGKCNQLKL